MKYSGQNYAVLEQSTGVCDCTMNKGDAMFPIKCQVSNAGVPMCDNRVTLLRGNERLVVSLRVQRSTVAYFFYTDQGKNQQPAGTHFTKQTSLIVSLEQNRTLAHHSPVTQSTHHLKLQRLWNYPERTVLLPV